MCSDEDPSSSQYIAPFVSHKSEATPESGNGKELLAAIAAYLETRSEFRIVTQDDNNLQIEARSRLLRFVDDIEMRVRGNSVVVRSASRVGYSDLGKNRRRLESIRQAMIERAGATKRLVTPVLVVRHLQSLRLLNGQERLMKS